MPIGPASAFPAEARPSQPLPLPEAQEGLWYAQQLDPANPIHNTAQYLTLRGALDVEAFRRAVDAAHAETDALAVRVQGGADGPVLVMDEAMRARLQVIDLRGEADPSAAASQAMRRDMDTPLDPARDPMAAEMLFVLGDAHHIWYQRAHHLVLDGYGKVLLTRRIADLYTAGVRGIAPATAPLARLAGVLADDAAYRDSERRESDRAYWLEAFADCPEAVSLAPGTAISARTCHRGGVDLDAAFCAALRALADGTRVAWPDIATVLIAAYVQRHVGDADVIAGMPVMGRLGTPAARVPCMVMNVLPVRFDPGEDMPLAEMLPAFEKQFRRARRHGRYRSEQLRRDLGLVGGQRRLHGPIVNVLPLDEAIELPGLETGVHILGTGAIDDITVTLRGDIASGAVRLEIEANPALYTMDAVNGHVDRLACFLRAALRAEKLADVPTLTPEEHGRFVHGVNATAHPVPDTTLTDLIAGTIRRTPAAPALRFDGETLTYAELGARVDRLAGILHRHGVGRGDVVGVALPRSLELVVALVAIQRAGAAYLPIDPDHPADRIAAVLATAEPRLVLIEPHLRGILPGATAALPPDGGDGTGASTLPVPPRPDDAAYIIYTSGSTGLPKGVVIEHRAIVNRLLWMRDHYGVTPDERILQKTPATFDVSVWEFFLPLIAGATLVIAPPEAHKDPAWLARIIRDEGITTLHFVPSMLSLFLAEPSVKGMALARVFCSGEELPAGTRDRFHERLSAELHNLYGPTEAAVDVTFWPAGAGDGSDPVPIGFPVWNTQLYVLDARLRPVPPGVAGDLYIAGVQLAREYLRQPDITRERFIANPWDPAGGRMYKTGDMARWRADGALEFLGRSDHQMKIRGQRVEAGDIESALLSSGRIGQAVVMLREAAPGDQRLIAYVTPRGAGEDVDTDALAAHAAARLPGYMVPARIVVLPVFPLSRNGKLDRAALPLPHVDGAPLGRMPSTATERQVAAIFAEVLVLPVDRIGADDDFFLLGGHSLLAAKVSLAARERWGRDIGFGALFASPTVAQFAARIDDLNADADGSLGVLIRLRGDGGRPPLFCFHPAGGISWSYAGLARALRTPRPVYGVQARGLDPAHPLPETLDAMAGDYIGEIVKAAPEGPYHLAGWSVGGIIAHTVAARLQAMGRPVGVVAMLDAYPADCWRNEPDPGEGAALKALLNIAGQDPSAYDGETLTRERVMETLRRAGHPLGALTDDALTGVIRVVESNNRLVRGHVHGRFDGTVLHFGAALDHAGRSLYPGQWLFYARRVESHAVPALHAHLTGPEATARIAPLLDAALAAADNMGGN